MKYPSSAVLVFLQETPMWRLDSPHKKPVMRKTFPSHHPITRLAHLPICLFAYLQLVLDTIQLHFVYCVDIENGDIGDSKSIPLNKNGLILIDFLSNIIWLCTKKRAILCNSCWLDKYARLKLNIAVAWHFFQLIKLHNKGYFSQSWTRLTMCGPYFRRNNQFQIYRSH